MITDAFIVLQKHFPFSCEEFLSCQRQIFLFFWLILGGQGRSGTIRRHASVTKPGWRSAEIYARSAKTRERRSAVAGVGEWTLEWGEGAKLDAH
jgi:predicted metallopeptidase